LQRIIQRRKPADPGALEDSQLHPLLARVYAARGIASEQDLALDFSRLLPPAGLLGVHAAASLLADTLERGDRVLVVGDFDADGATSTALAVSLLRACGARDVDYLVPNRFEFGYGLTPEIVALATTRSPDLIVTVDNGISSLSGVDAASAAGIATLITDHHLPGAKLPAADVIVNPCQPGCDFESKSLAGVGVIFYVMLALRAELRTRGWFENNHLTEPRMADYLDLVALGTVADVVPLDRNNRILVAGGLQRIRAGKARPGIRALLEVAGRSERNVVASDLGFAVGPRLNAAGRLDDMSIGIECLLSDSEQQAREIASRLHQLNLDRRQIEQEMQQQALGLLADLELELDQASTEPPLAYSLYREGWHQGVVGLLASRIKDRTHRPTIAFADAGDDEVKGSARSIPGLHIRDILDAVATRHPGLIDKFGGHAMAAGLSLSRSKYQAFSEAFEQEVARHAEDVSLQAVVESDGELAAAEFDLGLATQLRFAGPWGQHFPEPVFDGEFEIVSQRLVAQKHLKLVLNLPGSVQLLDAIAFNVDLEAWPDQSAQRVRLAYRLDVNEFRGQQSLQLMVEHLEHPE
jgi:single-stranded-DNA-specific exonuclease